MKAIFSASQDIRLGEYTGYGILTLSKYLTVVSVHVCQENPLLTITEYSPRVFGKVFSNSLARSGSFMRLPNPRITSLHDISRAKDATENWLTSTARLVNVLHAGSGRI